MPNAPPEGIYVPAVVFYNEKDELDIPSIQAHVLRLANVSSMGLITHICFEWN